MKSILKILIIKHGSLGDLVLSTGAIKSISNHFNNSKVYLLTSSKYDFLIKKSPYIDDIFFDDRHSFFNFKKNISVLKKIIQNEFDYIFDLQNSKRTLLYNLFFRIFTKSIISSSRKFAHHRYLIPGQGKEHVTEGLNNQLKMLGINILFKPNLEWLIEENEKNILDTSIVKPYVIIIPGSSKSGIYKRWSINNYSKVINLLVEKNYTILLVGSNQDKDTILPISKNCPKAKNYIGKSDLINLYRISKSAKFIISNDTGPAHLASLSGTPLVWIVNDNNISISNQPFGEKIIKISDKRINDISPDQVIKILYSKKLIN